MRVLLVSLSFPDDPAKVHGVFRRLDLFVDALAPIGQMELLFFVDEQVDVSEAAVERFRSELSARWQSEFELTLVRREAAPERLSRWDAYVSPAIYAFRQPGLHRASGPRQREALEAALDRRPDLLFVHRLTAMVPVLETDRALPPVVFDLDDIEHRAFARDISQPPTWPGKYLRYLQVPALWWAERRALARAECTFVCSPGDAEYLWRTMRVRGVEVIPNAVEVPEPVALPQAPTALLLGSLGYAPNQNAAIHLMREIWPRVRKRVPDAALTIAGPNPEAVPGHDDPPAGVTFSGFIENLAQLYADTRVVCTPIFAGGGTRIKVIEAGAYGRPVVSTTLGAEGLDLQNEREILLRDDPDSFSAAVAELMLDDERARRIGEAARARVERTYDRGKIIERIRAVVLSSLRTRRPAG